MVNKQSLNNVIVDHTLKDSVYLNDGQRVDKNIFTDPARKHCVNLYD